MNEKYLEESELINYSHPKIKALAKELAFNLSSDEQIAKKTFEYVRDEIRHSADYKDEYTTKTASEVLEYKTGWCYSKSLLLTALLRANNIPSALCYQRFFEDGKSFLHGLNAVFLKNYGWYKIDARGNKKGVNAQFNPPFEHLAFSLGKDDYDLEEFYSKPLNIVVEKLNENTTYDLMKDNLPDL